MRNCPPSSCASSFATPLRSRRDCSNSIRTLCGFSSAGQSTATPAAPRRKVEQADVTQALTGVGEQVRYTQLRDQIMDLTECSKRTAQLAITEACRQGSIVQTDGQYRLPL